MARASLLVYVNGKCVRQYGGTTGSVKRLRSMYSSFKYAKMCHKWLTEDDKIEIFTHKKRR